ncbi:MAG: flagellar export protein FliJ [Methylococcaceae bacterium]|jgi:flagellar FliJ protein
MTKRSKRIETIVNLKALQEKNALEVLGISQRKLQEMHVQIESLKNYRIEYQKKLAQLNFEGNYISRLLEFRSFLDKLDKAIAGQEQAAGNLKAECDKRKQEWEIKLQDCKSLQKVYLAAAKIELKHEEKREQRLQDESSARIGGGAGFGIKND